MTYDPAQGDGAQLMDIMQMQAALNGYSIVDPSEAAVTPGSSSLTVDVAGAPSGARLGGPAESFSGETGVAAQPRFDRSAEGASLSRFVGYGPDARRSACRS